MTRVLAALVLVAVIAACGDDSASSSVTVLAAASLTDAFTEIADAFEADHPGVTVTLSFAASSTLREQILEGAPADVFASADTTAMEAVTGDGAPFATNAMEVAVPAGNDAGVAGLADFADEGLLLGLCADSAPCGRLGRETLEKAGVTPVVDTLEPDVRSLLTKIEAGELDAGIVYRTDVLAAGAAVDGIRIPKEHNVVTTYPIAALTDAGDTFVTFVLSRGAQDILDSYGFGAP